MQNNTTIILFCISVGSLPKKTKGLFRQAETARMCKKHILAVLYLLEILMGRNVIYSDNLYQPIFAAQFIKL